MKGKFKNKLVSWLMLLSIVTATAVTPILAVADEIETNQTEQQLTNSGTEEQAPSNQDASKVTNATESTESTNTAASNSVENGETAKANDSPTATISSTDPLKTETQKLHEQMKNV